MWSQFPRIFVVGVASLVIAACSGGDGGGPKGSDNTVAASVAPTGKVSVYLNKSQSVSITFGTSDGKSASALSASLAALPVGWVGPSGGFECPTVGAGATCTLALQYLPTAPGTGTFVLGYSYRANNGVAKAGAVTIDYAGLSPTLELLAGSIGGSGNLDGMGATARFWLPGGVAVDGAGTLYVADASMIRKVTREGVVTTLAGAAGEYGYADGVGTAARFEYISGIAVDRGGMLYVADTYNDTIRKISPQGLVTTLAGSPSQAFLPCRFADGVGAMAAFCMPRGVAVDGGGTVYVADTQNALIRRITPAGVVTTLAGGLIRPRPCDPYDPCQPGPSSHCPPPCPLCPSIDGSGPSAGFGYPYGIAVDADGTLYVADSGPDNTKIRKITPAGVVTTLAGGAGIGFSDGVGLAAKFWEPKGIAVDAAGTVYVVDGRSNAIRRITSAGSVTTLAGAGNSQGGSDDGTGTSAHFLGPEGVAVDAAGVVYVADTSNATIRRITPDGVVTTFAGDAAKTGFADGIGAAARFNWPGGIAVNSGGVAYVGDYSNFSVRAIAPNGAVTTVVGSPSRYGIADGTGAAARFSCPGSIAVDERDTLYVVESCNHTIRKISPGGVVTTLAGTAFIVGSADGTGPDAQFGLGSPAGIAVDDAGILYVADPGNHTIRRVTPDGMVTTLAGFGGFADGIVVDLGRSIFVTDGGTTILRIDPPDIVTTLAGTAGERGAADGVGAAARFDGASGIAVDAKGNLYVADSWNGLIRKVTPAGVVTTILGERGSNGIRLGNLPASLSFPSSVAVRPDGQLLISDGNAILVTRGL
jgi:sugar lactone lactonase YvrE